MNKHLFLTIWLVGTALLLLGNNEHSLSLSKVTPEGGVTYNSILCIGEDEMGFIWFGSNDGLFSYNSVEIKRYSHFQNDSSTIPTNRINKIYTDYLGKLWIATENGLCSYNRKKNNFSNYIFNVEFSKSTGKNINSFFQTEDSTYWFADEIGVGTIDVDTKNAFYKNINNKTARVRIISLDDNGTLWVFFADGEIYYLLKDSNTFNYFPGKGLANTIRSVLIDDQNIWICYENLGVLCFNLDGMEKYHYKVGNNNFTALPSDQTRSILKDENGRIWIGTYNGIAIIEDYKIVSVINQDKYSELPNHSIWSLFKDSQKNIWIGTYLGGLCFYSEYNNSFFHYTQSAPKSSLSYNVVSSFVQVPNQNQILIGTEGEDINLFDPETNMFTTIPVLSEGRSAKSIKSLTYNNEGTLWVGTYGEGVFYKKPADKNFYRITPPFPVGIQALDLLASDEGIWVSNYPLGVYFYNSKSKTFTPYQHNPLDINTISDNNVRKIIQDKNGNLWFATQNGLNLLKKGSTKFIHFFNQGNNANSISGNIIYAIHEDDEGYLWLGTNGQGLDKFNPETEIAEHFSIKEGLPGNEIFSFLQDGDKNLWITTNQGICMLNPKTKDINTFNSANGIQNNRFNPNAAMVSSNGELYFGGTNGFIRFLPSEMSSNPLLPSTIITHLYINNKEMLPGTKNDLLNDIIGKTKSLKLNYKQNSISFRFVSSNYIDPSKNRFKYRLVGFNDEWIETDINGQATFTKVSPGKYNFEVKSANNDGIWSENPTQISIRIIPPVWERWYALVVYTLFVIMTILFFRQQLINKQKLKNEIELEKVKRENEDNLHQMKLQFFTNISHEFRTPLTLIQGPVNRLLNATSEKDSTNKQLSLIKNNTERLLRLINQFLDFRKIDSGKLKLSPVHTDILSFCKSIFSCFEDHASHRSFEFLFKTDISSLKMDFDPDKLDKVLFNILSNAFKNTSDGGMVLMEIRSSIKTTSELSGSIFTLGEEISGDFIELSITD